MSFRVPHTVSFAARSTLPIPDPETLCLALERWLSIKNAKLLKRTAGQFPAQPLLEVCSHPLMDVWEPESAWGHRVTNKDQIEVATQPPLKKLPDTQGSLWRLVGDFTSPHFC